MRDLLIAAVVGAPFVVGAAVAVEDESVTEVFTFADEAIVESSGLVVDGRQVVTVNDSGDSARVFTVDLGSGETIGVTEWDGEADDLEALAPAGAGQVWAADIGDNGRTRSDVTVTRVPVGRGDRSVEGEAFRLTMPDGPADAESLLAHPVTGRLYVVTKGALGGRVLAAPEHLEAGADNRLEQIGTAPGLVTDGSFFPDGHHLVLRDYDTAWVYAFPSLALAGSFDLPEQRQGEGIAVAADEAVYVSSEGRNEALLRVAIPAQVRAAMAAGPTASAPATSRPGSADRDGARDDSVDDSAGGDDSGPQSWPWFAGGLLGVLAVILLFRSLRPR